MGFQHMPEVVRRAAQAKGGRVKTKKGLAAMSPEKRHAAQSKGGLARHDNRSRTASQSSETDTGGNRALLERIIGSVDEEKL
jgi:hypothetical protein